MGGPIFFSFILDALKKAFKWLFWPVQGPVMQEQVSYHAHWLFSAIVRVLLASKPGKANWQCCQRTVTVFVCTNIYTVFDIRFPLIYGTTYYIILFLTLNICIHRIHGGEIIYFLHSFSQKKLKEKYWHPIKPLMRALKANAKIKSYISWKAIFNLSYAYHREMANQETI